MCCKQENKPAFFLENQRDFQFSRAEAVFPSDDSFRDINVDLLLATVAFLLTVHALLRKRPVNFAAPCPVSSCFSGSFLFFSIVA